MKPNHSHVKEQYEAICRDFDAFWKREEKLLRSNGLWQDACKKAAFLAWVAGCGHIHRLHRSQNATGASSSPDAPAD